MKSVIDRFDKLANQIFELWDDWGYLLLAGFVLVVFVGCAWLWLR